MDVQLTLSDNTPINFQPGCSGDFAGRILAGSTMYSATDKIGTLVVQELIADHFAIRYNIFQFFQKVSLKRTCRDRGLYIRVVLKGNIRHRIKGLGKINLKERQFAMIYADSGECIAWFDKAKEYHVIDLYFSSQLLEPLVESFPGINELFVNHQKPLIRLTKPECETDENIRTAIEALFDSPYEKSTGLLYIEDRVKELLELLLQKAFSQQPAQIKFSPQEISAIHAAREFIENNYRSHFTILQLARRVGINEFKLKAGFRQIFQLSMFDCLIQVRMQEALDLVLKGEKSIKEISFMVGYKRLPSFVTAFRKYYGNSPGKMRYNK